MNARLCLTLLFLLISGISFAADYIYEMPSAARVMNEIKGFDLIDTKAKQFGAIWQLGEMGEKFRVARGGGGTPTAIESKLGWEYSEANLKLLNEMDLLKDAEHRRWEKLREFYKFDQQFKKDIIQHFFSTAWQANYASALEKIQKDDADSKAEFDSQFDQFKLKTKPVVDISTWYMKAVIAFILICPILLVICILRELRPFRLNNSDPTMLQSGFSKYKIYTFNGYVKYVKDKVLTRTHTTYRNGVNQGSYTTNTQIQEIYVQAEDMERVVELRNSSMQVREGNYFSGAFAIKSGKKLGTYFYCYNHDTKQQLCMNSKINLLLKPMKRTVIPLWFTYNLICILFLKLYDESGIQLKQYGLKVLGTGVLFVLLFFIFRFILKLIRLNRFIKKDIPTIKAMFYFKPLI